MVTGVFVYDWFEVAVTESLAVTVGLVYEPCELPFVYTGAVAEAS